MIPEKKSTKDHHPFKDKENVSDYFKCSLAHLQVSERVPHFLISLGSISSPLSLPRSQTLHH